MKNYKEQLQRRFNSEINEMEAHHNEELRRTAENNKLSLDNLRHAYDVRISEEAEALEEKLKSYRNQNNERIQMEKMSGEQLLEQVKFAEQNRIEEYRKHADEKLESVRQQYLSATKHLEDQVQKNARKQKEITRHE